MNKKFCDHWQYAVLLLATYLAVLAVPKFAFAQTNPLAKPCEYGAAVSDQPNWEYLANNSARKADDYAVRHNQPNALPAFGSVDVQFQYEGEFKGFYLVLISHQGSLGDTFMMLRPNFEFCSDASAIDDGDESLFDVVVAKFNGVPF